MTEEEIKEMVYNRATVLAKSYIDERMIKALKNSAAVRKYKAFGKYRKSIDAEVSDMTDGIMEIFVSGIHYSSFVEGETSEIKKKTMPMNRTGNAGSGKKAQVIVNLEKWVNQRNLVFTRRYKVNTSIVKKRKTKVTKKSKESKLTSLGAAFAIYNKYYKYGRKPRFFIDNIMNKEVKKMKREILNKLENEFLKNTK